MRIANVALLGVLGILGATACNRVGSPRTITDRLGGFFGDDAGAAEASEEPAPGERGAAQAMAMTSSSAPRRDARPDAPAELHAEGEDLIVIEDDLLPGSRRLLETATVLAAPAVDAPALGMIVAGTRVGVVEEVKGEGCASAWLHVAPRGYVCAASEASREAPSEGMLPRVPAGGVVPGVYGKVAADAIIYPTREAAARGVGGHAPARKLTVHRLGRDTLGGRAFWHTREGWIAADQIVRHRGSSFSGVRLDAEGAPTLPMAWVLARPGAERATVPVLDAPRAGARVVDRLKPRAIVSVGETERGFVAVDGGFIAAADLRIARAAEPPEDVAEGERWVDVDLGQQVLVAYEGSTPVYATMVSSGRANHRTPTGVFRVERKVAERTMNSMSDSDEEYTVAKVPWTAYFAKGYALHAAYWHDGFGRPRSHGCVNLAPKDARALYAFLAPAAAPGWTEIYGHEHQPGTVIRVKSPKDPEPAAQGYMLAMR
jgi:hypothetical protein